jgi:hypothetical protein
VDLFRQIRDLKYMAAAERYRLIGRAIRAKKPLGEMAGETGQSVVLEEVLQAIRTGDLRDPGSLIGYVRATLRRQLGFARSKVGRVTERPEPAAQIEGNPNPQSDESDVDCELQIR